MKIHIFNPDTDLAQASGNCFYNAPRQIVEFTDAMSRFPETYAEEGDEVVPYSDLSRIPEIISRYRHISDQNIQIYPWGWNATIRHRLIEAGVDESILPSDNYIADIRRLAHRHTTIEANRLINACLIADRIIHISPIPEEFDDTDTAMVWLKESGRAFFKAPWSSSGRGVICSDTMSEAKLREWISGCIRRQGSVMGEIAADKIADFATEWSTESGRAEFIGFSFFETSGQGNYHGNLQGSQTEIFNRICAVVPGFESDCKAIIDAQRKMLDKLIAPCYKGPLGIDMLADHSGQIRACVEINLRMTMGMAAILRDRRK